MAAGPALDVSYYVAFHLLALAGMVVLALRSLGDYFSTKETRGLVSFLVYSSFSVSELALVWFAVIHSFPFVLEPYPWFQSTPWLLTASAVFLSAAAMAFLSSWLMDMERLCVVPWIVLAVSVTYLFLIDHLLGTISPFYSVTSAQPTVKVIIRQIIAVTSAIFLILGLAGYAVMMYLYTKIKSLRILVFLLATGVLGMGNFIGDAVVHLIPSVIFSPEAVNPTHDLHLKMLVNPVVNVFYLSAVVLLMLSELGYLDRIFGKKKVRVVEGSWIDKELRDLG